MTVHVTCYHCKMSFWVTDEFSATAHQTEQTFYCPAGHGNSWRLGETDDVKLRRECDRLKQEQAWYEDRIKTERASRETAERKLAASKGQITKIKKRAANGVCPCCNRTFSDLARHMGAKHPGYVAEPTADEHVH